MIMTLLERKEDDTCFVATQGPRLPPKVRGVSSFNLKPNKAHVKLVYLAVVAILFSVASGKPANPCSTETQFWVENEDGSASCVNCPSCPPGQTLSLQCGTGKLIKYGARLMCVPCPSGVSFSNKDDTSTCTPCSSCAEDQVILRNCTPELDIKCEKRCNSKDRYYDDAKGDCFHCSKCCHDDQDVVEDECQQKLGAESNMVCSFDSSVNRCDQSTSSPLKPTTITSLGTTTSDATSPSQGSNREHTIPPTAQPRHPSTTTTAKGADLLTSVSIPVVFMALLVAAGCCIYKGRQMCSFPWCSCDTEIGTSIPDSEKNASKSYVVHYKPTKNSVIPPDVATLVKSDQVGAYAHDKISTESLITPLLEEAGSQEHLACSCQQDSKLLNGLLNSEDDLREICVRLDTPMAGAGNYREVAQNYGLNHYTISSVLEKHERGPSGALVEWLAATKPKLTVQEFATVVKEKAKRMDVVELLEAYDSKKELENALDVKS